MAKNRKLGRTSDQRRAMLRAMTTYLLENGQIKTTYSRAKEVAPIAEKMITLAKKNNLAAYRQVLAYVTKEDVAKKLFDQIGPKYADRNGGYTRVLKLGPAATPPRWRLSSWCKLRFPSGKRKALCLTAGGFLRATLTFLGGSCRIKGRGSVRGNPATAGGLAVLTRKGVSRCLLP